MDFSLGYRLFDDGSDTIYEIVKDFDGHIKDVYFAYATDPSGRSALCADKDLDTIEYQIEELSAISNAGCSLTLLLNAACYGKDSVSQDFEKKIASTIKKLSKSMKISKVTTTSVFVAQILKKHFPHISVCASVNMRAGSIKAYQQLCEYFDEFYMQREFNRDFSKIEELSSWCQENNKKLNILLNSGCLHSCAYQSFHDNLVAHEKEIDFNNVSASAIYAPCHEFLKSKNIYDAAAIYLANTWVMPHELDRYDRFFSTGKLATRLHTNPRHVVNAYVNRERYPNIFYLTEPNYHDVFAGYYLDTSLLDRDWYEKVLNCDKNCFKCGYCKSQAKKALIKL